MSPWSKGKRINRRKSVEERFFAKVDFRPGDCWRWKGFLHLGYGRVFVPAGPGKVKCIAAHRWAYERAYGPIPSGMAIDHLCRTPACVNPLHLEAVTQRENTLRGVGPAAVRAVATHCSRGHAKTPENTEVTKYGKRCYLCHLLKNQESAARKRQRRAA